LLSSPFFGKRPLKKNNKIEKPFPVVFPISGTIVFSVQFASFFKQQTYQLNSLLIYLLLQCSIRAFCRFTFKVVVEIEDAEDVVLECFGEPRAKKKDAEEHAAEGALWYLKHDGYLLETD
jgi:hypothetical protein